jgi:hypothetical protein
MRTGEPKCTLRMERPRVSGSRSFNRDGFALKSSLRAILSACDFLVQSPASTHAQPDRHSIAEWHDGRMVAIIGEQHLVE